MKKCAIWVQLTHNCFNSKNQNSNYESKDNWIFITDSLKAEFYYAVNFKHLFYYAGNYELLTISMFSDVFAMADQNIMFNTQVYHHTLLFSRVKYSLKNFCFKLNT